MKAELAPAARIDLPTIFEIHVRSVKYFCAGHYTDLQLEGWFQGRSSADYAGAVEHNALWLARYEGRPVGFVEFWSKSVSMLYVLPSFSGRGIGTIMLDFALESVGRLGARLIEIESLANAQTFYERFGFEKIGASRMVRPSGLEIETVLMERKET